MFAARAGASTRYKGADVWVLDERGRCDGVGKGDAVLQVRLNAQPKWVEDVGLPARFAVRERFDASMLEKTDINAAKTSRSASIKTDPGLYF